MREPRAVPRLSLLAVALGVLAGSSAAFLFAPDALRAVAGDDAGIRGFFAAEARRHREPPYRVITPAPAPSRRVVQTYARAYAPAPLPDYRFDAPAQRAIDGALFGVEAKRPVGKRALARRHGSSNKAKVAALGQQTVCVRLCDGFHFPLGAVRGGGDLKAQAGMCQSLCPGAPARLYVLPNGSDKIEEAVSLEGKRYDLLPVAFRHASAVDSTCSCRPQGAALDEPLVALLDDVTLRRGDVVMTGKGVRIFRGAKRWPLKTRDFVKLSKWRMSRASRATLAALDRINAHDNRRRAALREAQASRRDGRG